MALLKFELKEEHIKLLKHLRWSMNSELITSKGSDLDEYGESPFGGDDIIEDISLIIKGKPSNFNPIDDEVLVAELSDEDKENMIQIYNELPTALDIILYTGSFETGHYKSKWYDRNWAKYTPKN
jgi:hypothetical protein